MQTRKILLRIMLWSLGVAAVCGAAAILVAAEEVIWRVVGTAVATAVAAGLMMAVTLLVDREKSRWAGVLGMWLVVVEFLGALFLIWLDSLYWWGHHIAERVGVTMLFLGMTGLPAMLFLRLMHQTELKIAARAGLMLCGVVLLMLELAIWRETRWWQWEELWVSAWVVGGYGLLVVGCLVGLGVNRRWWRWVGVLAAAVGCAIAMVAIWKHLHEGAGVLTVITSVGCFVALANMVMMCPLQPGQLWLRWGTIACAGLTAVFVDVDAVWFAKHTSDLLMRLAGASGFMAGCGVLALGVLARLNKGVGQKAVLSEIRELVLICPGCQKKQTVSVGEAQCPGCNLKFQIRIEEPRCPQCDYLLYMLKSDRCPECGAAVAGR